jgi:hypothetical protein
MIMQAGYTRYVTFSSDQARDQALVTIIELADREVAYYRLVDLFLNGTLEIRKTVTDGWPFGAKWVLPSISRLSCVVGETRSNRSRIIASIAYIAISSSPSRQNNRDILLALAVIYQCSLRCGLNPAELFELISRVANPDVAALLAEFIQRDEPDKSMAAFKLVEVVNLDGEVEIWPDFYTPPKNVGQRTVEISA